MNDTGTGDIHHVTPITRRVRANVDFHAGFLGLRLVKHTGCHDDAPQLHLFYGDRLGLARPADHFSRLGNGAPLLADWIGASGTGLEWHSVDAGHESTAENEALARQWLAVDRESGRGKDRNDP